MHFTGLCMADWAGPALVAQGIEHRSPKAGVAGSNPAGGAPSDLQLRRCRGSLARSVGITLGISRPYACAMARRDRRPRGHIEERPNGSFRAVVFAGIDPITKK